MRLIVFRIVGRWIRLGRGLLAGMVMAGVVLAGGDPPTPTPPPLWPPVSGGQLVNLIQNPGMEQAYLNHQQAIGWQMWYEDTGKPPHAESLDYVVPPFFSAETLTPALIHGGLASQHIGRLYDPWHGGLKQTVMTAPGASIKFCAYGRLYASNRDYGHEASWAAINGRAQVGIFPEGEADWNAAGVIWSAEYNPHDTWQNICVEATAGSSGRVTVFTSTNYRGFAAKHLDAWWDDAELTIDGGSVSMSNPWMPSMSVTQTQPLAVLLLVPSLPVTTTAHFVVVPAQVYAGPQGMTLTLLAQRDWPGSVPDLASLSSLTAISNTLPVTRPVPGFSPTPATTKTASTATLTPTVSAMPLATKIQPAATPVATPANTAQLCLRAFLDRDGNGQMDPGELPLPGVMFTISQSGKTVATYTTDDHPQPSCKTLPSGDYVVSISPAENLSPTTQTQWSFALTANAIVDIQFGAQRIEATPASAYSTTSQPMPAGLIGIFGVVIAGAAGALVISRRR